MKIDHRLYLTILTYIIDYNLLCLFKVLGKPKIAFSHEWTPKFHFPMSWHSWKMSGNTIQSQDHGEMFLIVLRVLKENLKFTWIQTSRIKVGEHHDLQYMLSNQWGIHVAIMKSVHQTLKKIATPRRRMPSQQPSKVKQSPSKWSQLCKSIMKRI